MPNPAEICEVFAAGGSYQNWHSVTVNWALDQNWHTTVDLICAEPSQKLLQLVPGDDFAVYLAGHEVLRAGLIRTRDAALDAGRHAVNIQGWGNAGETTKHAADIKGGQLRDYDLLAIAKKAVEPLGLKVRWTNPPEGAKEKFDNVIVHTGESIFHFIERLARMRDCFIWAEHDGTINLGLPDSGGGSATLEEGRNILAGRVSIIDPASEIRLLGQDAGTDERYGSRVAQLAATSTIQGFNRKRLLIQLAEEPVTESELKTRTRKEVRELLYKAVTAQITHQGWFKPGGGWWKIGDDITVKSPSLIPTASGTTELKVSRVQWTQNNESGTTTTVTAVNPAALHMRTVPVERATPLTPGGTEPRIEST